MTLPKNITSSDGSMTMSVIAVSNVIGTEKGTGFWPTYGRIMKLEHSGEHNGELYATSQWAGRCFPVIRSTDDGSTWEVISEVYEQFSDDLIANWQPHVFELPCRVGEMPEGTLLLAGCSHDRVPETHKVSVTKMCIWRSYDLGKTWEEISVVDEAGGTVVNDGMYEPFLICDKDGSLVCFYSDVQTVLQYLSCL